MPDSEQRLDEAAQLILRTENTPLAIDGFGGRNPVNVDPSRWSTPGERAANDRLS